MVDAAKLAFRSEASDKAAQLGLVLMQVAREFRRSIWTRLLEHCITAMAASCITAAMLLWIGH